MPDRPDYGAPLFLLMMAGVCGLAVLAAPAPGPRDAKGPGQAEQAFIVQLEQDVGPALGGCTWAEVSVRMEPAHLDAVLARAGGDYRQYPRLSDMVERAKARCRLSTPTMEAFR